MTINPVDLDMVRSTGTNTMIDMAPKTITTLPHVNQEQV